MASVGGWTEPAQEFVPGHSTWVAIKPTGKHYTQRLASVRVLEQGGLVFVSDHRLSIRAQDSAGARPTRPPEPEPGPKRPCNRRMRSLRIINGGPGDTSTRHTLVRILGVYDWTTQLSQ
jgi:hypothetical protein